MIKIGDFSQLAQVSIRTLRHYDDLHLLKPEFIDPLTNYRFYTIYQLPRLNRILALKELGLSLEQIAKLMEHDLPVSELRRLLVNKQLEMENQMMQWKEQTLRVEARLWQIEQEGKASLYDVIVRSIPTLTTLSLRDTVPSVQDMPTYRCAMFDALYKKVTTLQLQPVEPEMVFYHMKEFVECDIDIEIVIRIADSDFSDLNKVGVLLPFHLQQFPAEPTMATTIHNGSLFMAGQALFSLFEWIYRNGYTPCGPVRELHLFGRENDHVDINSVLIEIQIPIQKNN